MSAKEDKTMNPFCNQCLAMGRFAQGAGACQDCGNRILCRKCWDFHNDNPETSTHKRTAPILPFDYGGLKVMMKEIHKELLLFEERAVKIGPCLNKIQTSEDVDACQIAIQQVSQALVKNTFSSHTRMMEPIQDLIRTVEGRLTAMREMMAYCQWVNEFGSDEEIVQVFGSIKRNLLPMLQAVSFEPMMEEYKIDNFGSPSAALNELLEYGVQSQLNLGKRHITVVDVVYRGISDTFFIATPSGLFYTDPAGILQRGGPDPVCGVCLSPDEGLLFCVSGTGMAAKIVVVVKLSDEPFDMHSFNAIAVEASLDLLGLSCGPDLGSLAVVDKEVGRITVHTFEGVVVSVVKDDEQGKAFFTRPSYVDWFHASRLAVTHAKGVSCISVSSNRPSLLWETPLDGAGRLTFWNKYFFVVHQSAAALTILSQSGQCIKRVSPRGSFTMFKIATAWKGEHPYLVGKFPGYAN